MKAGLRSVMFTTRHQWRNTLPAIRSFVTANYNQPNPHNQAAMASPPTITVLAGSTPPVGVTVAYLYKNGAPEIRYSGGNAKTFSTDYRRAPVATEFTTGGNVGDGQNAITWRAEVLTNGQKVAFRLQGDVPDYRFIADDKYVALTGTAVPTGGGNYVTLDFGSAATRRVAIEGQATDALVGVYTAVGDVLTLPSAPKRMIVLGDSFIGATGATLRGDALALVAGDMLGIRDVWQSGIGGTGYINTVSGTKYNLTQRLGDANTTGPWDIIVVAMGINDIGQAAGLIAGQAALCLQSLRKSNPAAQIFAVGPWDVNAPAAPVANYAATKAAIQAAASSVSGVTFLDPEGVTYTKSDSTHPDDDGHQTLGEWLALQIKTGLGA